LSNCLKQNGYTTKINKASNISVAKISAVTSRDAKQAIWRFKKLQSFYINNSTPFTVDLVRAVLRQLQFAKKMPLNTWNKDDILNEAIIRYYKFLNLMKLYPGKLFVPTLDVDLVWHAHQLNPSDYHKFTLTNVGNFIDHNDNIEKPSLGNGFIETAQLWKQNYNEGYSPVSVFNKWVTPAKIAASVFFPPYAIYLGAKAISMRVYNKKGKCGVFNEKKNYYSTRLSNWI